MLKRNLKKIFTALLFLQGLLIVTGGAVRLTGSGLGCPTWPTCTGNSYKPVPHQAQGQLHAWIEFGNRLIAWLIFVIAILALIGIIKYLKDRSDYLNLRALAIWQLMGFVGQVVLGGITVLTKLNPLAVSGHFLLSIPLVAGAFSLRAKYLYQDHFQVNPTTQLLKNIFFTSVLVLIFIGTIVTGSGPLAGDVEAKRYNLDAAQIAHLHSYIGVTVLILLLGLIFSTKKYEDPQTWSGLSKSLFFALGVLVVEGAIGYRQFALGLPEILVGTHLLGATLLWVATWNIHLKMRNR
jgi:cytochrome c oxidase assembly protein subunit 15